MTLETILLLGWLTACARLEGVDPAFAAAVFHIESRSATQEFRFGPLGRAGKYLGPAGINRCFRAKWDIDNWRVNAWVGVRALRGRDERRVLQRYNASFTEAYYRAVLAAKRKYRDRF